MFEPRLLAKLSACPCGFLLLKEGISLGTVYEVDTSIWLDAILSCGGCKEKRHVACVMVRSPASLGYMPGEVFGLEPPTRPPASTSTTHGAGPG